MSLFKTTTLSCPACRADNAFETAASVNADRRPDLRRAILDDEFQRLACQRCGTPLRVAPDFTLQDASRGLWIAALPLTELADWPAAEARVRATFDESFGPAASKGAQAIGEGLRLRVTFGWAALREKLAIAEAGLDDAVVELAKALILKSGQPMPLERGTELRFERVDDDQLVFSWLLASDESPGPSLTLARSVYDEIEADLGEGGEGAWRGLQARLAAGPFVDIDRVLVAAPA